MRITKTIKLDNIATLHEEPDIFPIPLDVYNPPSNIPIRSWKERYIEIQLLGSGSFGNVVLAGILDDKTRKQFKIGPIQQNCRNRTGHSIENASPFVAVKTMNRKLPRIRDYNRVKEIRFILTVPSHPHLMKIYEVFVDSETYHLKIVMEPMQMNLYQLMQSRPSTFFSSQTLKSILSQILAGIRHIHRNSYFHRDIKPENILVTYSCIFYGGEQYIPEHRLLDKFVIKLADYGLARHIGTKRSFTGYVSTRWYRAPEILLRLGFYSLPIDIWAFGAVIYEVITFKPLFPGNSEIDQLVKISQIIGSPDPPEGGEELEYSGSSFFNPLGGYWDIAVKLFSNLGLHPRYFIGVHISDIIANNYELQKVMKRCLVWDPFKRGTLEEICRMKYFRDCSFLEEPDPRSFNEKPLREELQVRSPNKVTSFENRKDLLPDFDEMCKPLNIRKNKPNITQGLLKENISQQVNHHNSNLKNSGPNEKSQQHIVSKDMVLGSDFSLIGDTNNPNNSKLEIIQQQTLADGVLTNCCCCRLDSNPFSYSQESLDSLRLIDTPSDPFLDTKEWDSFGVETNPWKDINQGDSPLGSSDVPRIFDGY